MNVRFLSAAFVVMLWYAGCGPTTKLIRERKLPAEEVLRRVRAHDAQIRTVRGDGSMTFESPESSGSGSFEAGLKKPDSLRIDLSGPFGIRIGTLALSREEVLFYNWQENTATIGTPDAITLQAMLRIKLSFDEILPAFTGEFLSMAARDTIETFGVEDGLYVVRYKSREGVREFHIDGESFAVTSYRLLDDEGKASLVAVASRFEQISDISMPKLLRVIIPRDRRSLTIAYGDLYVNEEVRCSFAIPEHAEIIHR